MADLFQVGVYGGAGTKDLTVADHDGALGPGTPSNYVTGDLRRKYNFGDRVSELSLAQDPFFRFLSKVAKKPTDDPTFKWAEKRPSWNKRYAYVMGWVTSAGADEFGQATITAYNDGGTPVAGDSLKLYMAGDYQNEGNIQNIYGNTTNKAADVGDSGTTPQFFLPGQLIKIPMSSAAGTATTDWGKSYILARITAVDKDTYSGSSVDSKYPAVVTCSVVRASSSATYPDLAGWISDGFGPSGDSATDEVVADKSIATVLEKARTYVVGSAHAEGSGYPETWKDQPYSTNHGLTQIWKTSMAMTNTARATSLKFDSSEWSRVWKDKLTEHKWDIETSLLFGSQYTDTSNDIQYTQGAIDYINSYGNQFSLTISSKTADDFLDDLSNYLDPRYNNSTGSVFFVSTEVYNWMHKLGGYFKNNLELSSNFRADFAMTGKKKVLGVDITTFSTPYGDMNVARNIHLDGTSIKMLGINMKYCAYRPLVGNGINRDTSVYVGVQTLENSGIDRRVDLILTEAGMEWQMPECHAIWT